MSHVRWIIIAALVAAPVAVASKEKSTPIDPADPAASSAQFQYESAFANYRQLPQEQEADGSVWRAANDEMAKLGGHGGHIKSSARSPSVAEDAGPEPVKPDTQDAPVSPKAEGMPATHGQHGMDHKRKGK